MSSLRSSDYTKFFKLFQNAKRIVALTGAGVSAESGVPTFRGAGGLWRRYRSTELATPEAFKADPALVWQFYAYRRQLVATKQPNPAHKALAYVERQFSGTDRTLDIITQNVDGLHRRAGSQRVVELHGNLYRTRCTKCGTVEENNNIPIVPALANVSTDAVEDQQKRITLEELPHCTRCAGLLRPHIVWFGESLESEVLDQTDDRLANCDLLLVIGTSSVVYPAASYAPRVAARGVPVAEFNLERTSASDIGFFFQGPAGETLPQAFGIELSQLKNTQ